MERYAPQTSPFKMEEINKANYISNNRNYFTFHRFLTVTCAVDNLTIIFFYGGGIIKCGKKSLQKKV